MASKVIEMEKKLRTSKENMEIIENGAWWEDWEEQKEEVYIEEVEY